MYFPLYLYLYMYFPLYKLLAGVPVVARVNKKIYDSCRDGPGGSRTRIHYVCSNRGPNVQLIELIHMAKLRGNGADLHNKTSGQ